MPVTTELDVRTIQDTDLQTRDGTKQAMQIQGYAARWNQPSNPMPFVEYMDPHCLDDVDLSQVQLLYAHNYDNILARADSGGLQLKVDDKGLFFSATLPDTTLGRDTYQNILSGNLKGCSFGFMIADDEWSTDDNGTTIHLIKSIGIVREISITGIPAYSETSVNVTRSLDDYLKKEGTNVNNDDGKSTASSAASSATSSVASSAASAASSSAAPAANDAVNQFMAFLTKLLKQGNDAGNNSRDDGGDDVEEDDDTNKPRPDGTGEDGDSGSAATPPANNSAASSAASAANSAGSGQNKEGGSMATSLVGGSAATADKAAKMQKRSFKDYLMTGEVRDDTAVTEGGLQLKDGAVIIPETILTPEKEQHQFARLGSLVRTIAVKTTTGKVPIFMETSGVLSKHTEYAASEHHGMPEILPVKWDLSTYTGNYLLTQDLIQDSAYDWSADLNGRLSDLRDNTDDNLIISALTKGITATNVTDFVAALKTALDQNLKPTDSANASIVLSQSAFAALDLMTDTLGRPLIQPDLTNGIGNRLLGKTVVVVDDTLFPGGKAGAINGIVAPLQKAVIRFKQSEITGQFIDSYDVWYKILGIYLREDVEQARPDLITWITGTAGSLNQAAATPATGLVASQKTASMKPGDTRSVTVTTMPVNASDAATVIAATKWASDNKAAVTVDASGTITAVADGTANVTATSGDLSTSIAVTVASA